MRSKGTLSSFMLLSLTTILFLGMPSLSEAFDQNFVGAYFAAGQSNNQDSSLVITIGKEGNISVIYSIQGTILFDDSFTDEQGVCKKSGPSELTCRTVSFDYFSASESPPKGKVIANTVDDYVITFAPGFQEISVTASGRGYAPDVNPLDPGDATPVFTFTGSFEGQRVTVP